MTPPASADAPADATDAAVRLGVWAGRDNDFALLDPILDRLPGRFHVRRFTWSPDVPAEVLTRQLARVDVAWLEGCDGPAAPVSRLAHDVPVFCRFLRDTLYTDVPRQMDWAAVDHLAFHTPGLQQRFTEQYGAPDATEMSVVPGGIALDEIGFDAERARGFDVAFAGGIHYARNPMLALQIFRTLVDRDARYQLHVAGPIYHIELAEYLAYQTQQLGLGANVHFYGPLDAARGAAFLRQCTFLLDTSVREDYPFAALEAMAIGLKPVVHDFAGARDIFPTEILFNTVDEAVALLTEEAYVPAVYRRFVEEHYGLARQIDAYAALLDGLVARYYPDGIAPTA